MPQIAHRFFLIVAMAIVLAGCSPTDRAQPISNTPPAAGEVPRAINRGVPKFDDGSERGAAVQESQ